MIHCKYGLFWTGIGLILTGCSRDANEFVEPPPPTVVTAQPQRLDVTLFIEQNGETEATESAEVRARVRGFLRDVLFEAGQAVTAGDALYQIEPDEYLAAKRSAEALVTAAEAAISVAEAGQEAAQAEQERAEAEYKRFRQLLETNATSQAEYESALAQRNVAQARMQTAAASIQAAEAELLTAKANLAQADLDFDYTVVKAPIDGRISQTIIDKGNLADNGSVLATITDRRQIYAHFNISDRELLDLMNNRPEDSQAGPMDWSTVQVFLRRDEREDSWLEGRLNYVDQEGIDQATGTFALRALFDNADNLLVPGMFVTIRLPIALMEDAQLIPYQAVARGQEGAYVLRVNADGEVEKQPVQLGEQVGRWIVVSDGLQDDDTFVLEGLQQAMPGTKVVSKPAELKVADSPELQAMLFFSQSRRGESEAEVETLESEKSETNAPDARDDAQ